MPIVRPLRALRYGTDHAELLDRLISPATSGEPTDRSVVGDVHPLNVRQLVRGERGPLASADEPPFTHAARLARRWKEDGVLARDPRPSLYTYEQTADGVTRRGMVGLVRLSPWGDRIIRPHERTGGGSTARLLDQLAATRTQLSLVMAVVPDRSGALADFLAIRGGRPVAAVTDGDGRHNRIWRSEDPSAQLAVLDGLKDEPAVIADGHHRYEAALRYQASRAAHGRQRRDHPYDYVMMMLVPTSEEGLRCAPAHRVSPALSEEAVARIDRLSDHFEIGSVESDPALSEFLADPTGIRFGLVRRDRRQTLLLRADLDHEALLAGLPAPLRTVDAAVLDHLVLSKLEGAVASGASGSTWAHNCSSAADVTARALAGEIDLAILLRPTTPAQILQVAEAGEVMPPKSTNFTPKPAKGLLMNSLVSF